jgi:hypothetical protein
MNTATLTNVEDTETAEAPAREFSYNDRCDRCGPRVQAYFVAIKDDLEVTLCGHHGTYRQPSGNTHTEALVLQGWTVLDFTARLDQPLVSANVD